MADQHEVDLDSIIDRLLEVRGSRPGKQVQLLESEIRFLCTKAREIFISQPILLELEAPIKVSFCAPLVLRPYPTLRRVLVRPCRACQRAGGVIAGTTNRPLPTSMLRSEPED